MKHKLWGSYQVALRHLVKNHGLTFVEASKQIAIEAKKHSAEIERFRKNLRSATPKMRLLAERKMIHELEAELEGVEAKMESTPETIIRAGLLQQKIHDFKDLMAEDTKKLKKH